MGMEKEGVRGFWWEAARPGPDICLEVGTVSHWTYNVYCVLFSNVYCFLNIVLENACTLEATSFLTIRLL